MAKRKRERVGEPRRYTFKLYPSEEQNEEMFRQARMMADLWNALLQRNEDMYRRTRGQKGVTHAEGKSLLTFYDMTAEITQLRHACPEWADLSVWSPHRVANSLTEAFGAFFRRMRELADPAVYEARAMAFKARKGRMPTRYELAGYPRYRRTALANWLPHRFMSGCKLKPEGKERERPNGRKSHKKWVLSLKGVGGKMLARGELPSTALDWSDADLRHHNDAWWLSVGIERKTSRDAGGRKVVVNFDLVDSFAEVTGANVGVPVFSHIFRMDEKKDALQSERDRRWPWKPGVKMPRKAREMSRRIERLAAKIARHRRELLHRWTTDVISHAGHLVVIAPEISEEVHSGRGNEKEWGAEVSAVSALNRAVLSQAPASTIQMLEYKAAEAGIPCIVQRESDSKISVGKELPAAKKAGRRARRKVRELADETV